MLGVAFTLFAPQGSSRSASFITERLRIAVTSLASVDSRLHTALITSTSTNSQLDTLFSKVVKVSPVVENLCGPSSTGVKGQNWQLRIMLWQETPFKHTLFVDSDTIFCHTPYYVLRELQQDNVDIAYKVHFKRGKHPDNGAMYVRMTPEVNSFMNVWFNSTCGIDDQTSFGELVHTRTWSLVFANLPNTISARYLPAVEQGWTWNVDRFKDHTMLIEGSLISFHDARKRNSTSFCAMINNNTSSRVVTYTDKHPDRLAWSKRECDTNLNGSCRNEWDI